MDVQLSDGDVARRIRVGSDPEAESELVRRMAPRIRLYGLRHLRDHAAADDLTQHVLLTVLEALRGGRLHDPEKLGSFVLGTCRMTVLDLQRGRYRRERLLTEFGATFPMSSEASEPLVDQARLLACVQALKERERTVIVMTFYDERTGADLAKVLGVSPANVRVIRHRALHQLRDCMGVNV